MHVELADPEPLDELPDWFPVRRPRTYGYCLVLGLGITLPCPFATCRHNLLVDELRGETLPDLDIWERPTCSLAEADRGPHTSQQVAALTGLCETTAEEWSRRCIVAALSALGVTEFSRADKRGRLRYRRARHWGMKVQSTETDGLPGLVEAAWKRGVRVNPPAWRRLTRAEAEQFYPGKVSTHYGEPLADSKSTVLPAQSPTEKAANGAALCGHSAAKAGEIGAHPRGGVSSYLTK